ncbi:DNA mismatch repair protein MutS [Pelotomaculum sp. FP]|uniref:DNA mismatch repair protein MutS n=1 Tax=Pelotomaculum sp. FP TaxID=261474 RepID=UPI001064FF7A|nr:DNA mismatch repair protein MutS [Pelotomaculum sp. FP]
MIKQYLEIKQQYPDTILFFRLGDFYEMFFDDARLASRELEIALTGRDGGGSERVPMCGFPYHAADGYIARLLAKRYRVAICEQVEDPASAKGIVRREVTRVITPGTVMEGHLLEEKQNNYLVSIAMDGSNYSFAMTDISTGVFMVSAFAGEKGRIRLTEELARLLPAEVLLPLSQAERLSEDLALAGSVTVSAYLDEAYDRLQALRELEDQFGRDCPGNIKDPGFELIIPAAGALLKYLRDTQKRDLSHIRQLNYYHPGRFMLLDASTRRNLELTRSLSDGSRRNTLLAVLDYTVTAMGGRLIRNWLEQPLLEKDEIVLRLDAVDELLQQMLMRNDLKDLLKGIYDLERLAGRISFGTINARDMIALKKSLGCLPDLQGLLRQYKATLLQDTGRDIDPMEDLRELLEGAINDNPPLSLRDGGIIKTGFHAEVDRLRLVRQEGRSMLAGLEEQERARTGIKSLKVGFNKVFGYYIEVTRANLEQVPQDYQRKQTLANAERFITPELKEYEDLVLGAEDRLMQLEYQIFCEIRDQFTGAIQRLQATAAAIARADALYSLAEAAAVGRYVRPGIDGDGELIIKDGRHPVLEQVLREKFVPNDTIMDNQKSRLVMITGPNMAGKSTYMRQVALIIMMAQSGSFVPAASAQIPLVDRIFTRVGAADDLATGQSTFMMEMNECRAIVQGATKRSLIIMDEVGRGTSTYDGISIARALVEYIHTRIGAKTLFSTHYHELTDLDQIEGIINYNVAVKEDGENIVFLRKVVAGKSDRSYGIHVARLAGLPDEIVKRATDVLRGLETGEGAVEAAACRESHRKNEAVTLNEREQALLQKLRRLDVLSMTPLEALNQLYHLQQELKQIFK